MNDLSSPVPAVEACPECPDMGYGVYSERCPHCPIKAQIDSVTEPTSTAEEESLLGKMERLLLLPEWPNKKAWVEAVETAHALVSTPTPGRAAEPDPTPKGSVAASEAGRVGECRFCGSSPSAGETACSTPEEALDHTMVNPFGCPWLSTQDRDALIATRDAAAPTPPAPGAELSNAAISEMFKAARASAAALTGVPPTPPAPVGAMCETQGEQDKREAGEALSRLAAGLQDGTIKGPIGHDPSSYDRMMVDDPDVELGPAIGINPGTQVKGGTYAPDAVRLPPAPVGLMGAVRPEVYAFALLMEHELRANDHKPGWKNEKPALLINRVWDEAHELWDAIFPREDRTENKDRIGSEAADVANMAMMVADVCGCLDATLSGQQGGAVPAGELPSVEVFADALWMLDHSGPANHYISWSEWLGYVAEHPEAHYKRSVEEVRGRATTLRARLAEQPAPAGTGAFTLGDRVEKTKGSSWRGPIVGTYSTSLTPRGYAVESEREPGSVQIYPEAALRAAPAGTGDADRVEGLRKAAGRPCSCWACIKARGERPRHFVVCQTCGNKRCPHCSDHRFKCTGSNDVDQVGVLAALDGASGQEGRS